MESLQFGRPLQIVRDDKDPWHYAAGKTDRVYSAKPACPTKDMFCYFLPLSSCPFANQMSADINEIRGTRQEHMTIGPYRISEYDASFNQWLYEFSSRPQTWLRRRVYEFVTTKIQLNTPCSVMHVRRSDVTLHGDGLARRYFAVSEYLNASKPRINPVRSKNVFLLTDDHNAIGEALVVSVD